MRDDAFTQLRAALISAWHQEGSAKNVMMHDGSWVKLRKLAKDYDPTNRDAAYEYRKESRRTKVSRVQAGALRRAD